MKKRIAVFCSASYKIDPKYNKVAREFVRAASLCGYGVVSGGTVKGTMGEISDELHRCSGEHIGVIPRFMAEYHYPSLTDTLWTETMAERKTLMREGTVAAVALPGGIGTLDEVIETLTLRKLGKYDGEIYALDTEGFYEPFKVLLDHYVTTGMMDSQTREMIKFPSTVEELMGMLQK